MRVDLGGQPHGLPLLAENKEDINQAHIKGLLVEKMSEYSYVVEQGKRTTNGRHIDFLDFF